MVDFDSLERDEAVPHLFLILLEAPRNELEATPAPGRLPAGPPALLSPRLMSPPCERAMSRAIARRARSHPVLVARGIEANKGFEHVLAEVTAAGFAVFVLTGDCRVVFANAKAEDLVRRETGLRNERGRLAAATPALMGRLCAVARQGLRTRGGEGHAGGTLELSCGENRPPLLVDVIPLARNRTVASLDLDRPAAALFVIDPAYQPASSVPMTPGLKTSATLISPNYAIENAHLVSPG